MNGNVLVFEKVQLEAPARTEFDMSVCLQKCLLDFFGKSSPFLFPLTSFFCPSNLFLRRNETSKHALLFVRYCSVFCQGMFFLLNFFIIWKHSCLQCFGACKLKIFTKLSKACASACNHVFIFSSPEFFPVLSRVSLVFQFCF